MLKKIFILYFLFNSTLVYAQLAPGNFYDEDDLSPSGDIFSDFNEDLEASQVLEDERYYRYGRFFSFSINLGLTAFNGNRGLAYENSHPTLGLALNYFQDFRTSFGLGFALSKHHMYIEEPTVGFSGEFENSDMSGPGFIDVNLLRVFFSYRYYVDTTNLGTAITYSNPYATLRLEYWYQTDKFIDQPEVGDQSGGGFGFAIGGGLEFPMKIKESYIGLEFLMHTANLYDKYTIDYKGTDGISGYDDLTGYAFTSMVSYVISW